MHGVNSVCLKCPIRLIKSWQRLGQFQITCRVELSGLVASLDCWLHHRLVTRGDKLGQCSGDPSRDWREAHVSKCHVSRAFLSIVCLLQFLIQVSSAKVMVTFLLSFLLNISLTFKNIFHPTQGSPVILSISRHSVPRKPDQTTFYCFVLQAEETQTMRNLGWPRIDLWDFLTNCISS